MEVILARKMICFRGVFVSSSVFDSPRLFTFLKYSAHRLDIHTAEVG